MKTVIYGIGAMARVLYSYARHSMQIAGFTIDDHLCTTSTFCGLPLVPFSRVQEVFKPAEHDMLVFVGYLEMNRLRERKCAEAEAKGYRPARYVHSSVILHDDVTIEDYAVVLDSVSIHPGSRVGRGTFISSNVNIGHDCIIDPFNWINSGVALGGGCHIGAGCFFGVNSSTGHSVRLGAHNFIAASTSISRNTGNDEVYLSAPAELSRLKSLTFLKFSGMAGGTATRHQNEETGRKDAVVQGQARYPIPSLSGIFFSRADSTPDKAAIICEGESITYRDLSLRVRRLGYSLVTHGVRRGDHVGVLLPNSIDFVVLMLVACDLGLVLVPLNTTLPVGAIVQTFTAGSVRHLVSTDDTLHQLWPERQGELSSVDGLWLSVDPATEPGDYPDFATLIAEATPSPSPFDWGKPEDAFILTLTSGSTGDPKPITLAQRTKYMRMSAAVEMYGVTKNDVTVAATPLYHSLAERLVLIAMLTGGTLVLMARFSPLEWIESVRKHHVSFTIAVSSQLGAIAKALRDQGSIDSLRCVVSSSALLDANIKKELLDKLHCDLHECYGTSEIAIASTLDMKSGGRVLNSVGRAASGVAIKILRDDDSEAPVGTVGEIVCSTPMLFAGYYKRPDLTEAAMWGRYFRTGDLGKLDDDGFLYFVGRKKEIIITGGVNVYPSDIEAALVGYPGLVATAAFAVPDDRLGEVVGLAYVPEDPVNFDLRKLRHYCAKHLADFQQPHKFLELTALPRNAMEKLARKELLGMYYAREGDNGNG